MPNENKPSALALRLLEAAYEAVPGTLADKAPLSTLESRKAQRIDAELAPLRGDRDFQQQSAERLRGLVRKLLKQRDEARRMKADFGIVANAETARADAAEAKAEALAGALQALVDRSAWFDTGVTHVGLSNAAVLASARAALAEYEGDA